MSQNSNSYKLWETLSFKSAWHPKVWLVNSKWPADYSITGVKNDFGLWPRLGRTRSAWQVLYERFRHRNLLFCVSSFNRTRIYPSGTLTWLSVRLSACISDSIWIICIFKAVKLTVQRPKYDRNVVSNSISFIKG